MKDNKHNQENSFFRDILWNVINRFDILIEATNSKAALTIAFNTFIVSGIILKWKEILPSYNEYQSLVIIGGIFLTIASVASVLSLCFTFLAVKPFLKSHKDTDEYHSNIFFKDIAKYEKPGAYHEKVKTVSADSLEKDLAFQIHILSKGISRKFNLLRTATNTIFYFQLPAIAIFVIIKLIASISGSG